jgi:hypothetical protein
MQVVTLTHGQPQYADLLDQIRQDPTLAARMWADAESRPDELDLPGTWWSVALVWDEHRWVPAAWCAARVEDGALRAFCNYEVPAWRNLDLYADAYRERHHAVLVPSGLPAVTYLFPEPIALHEADGWERTGREGSGELDGHWWSELRWVA